MIESNSGFSGFEYSVPGDLSSSAFFVVLALIQQTKITLTNIDLSDLQPDKVLFDLISNLGGIIEEDPINQVLSVEGVKELDGFEFDLEYGIDLLPILSVWACFLKSPSKLYNGKIAREKESDRIHAMALELKKMGAQIEENADGLIIYPSVPKGASVNSHLDHRIAMALSIAATKAKGSTIISGIECVNKTFPEFFNTLKTLNAQIRIF